MVFRAGEALTAAELNQITVQAESATASAVLLVTTATQDVPGASFDITTLANNQFAFVIGIFDVNNAGADTFVGMLASNGIVQPGQAIAGGADRKTVSQVWIVSLPTAGTYTLKLQASKVGNAAAVNLQSTHTRIATILPGIV